MACLQRSLTSGGEIKALANPLQNLLLAMGGRFPVSELSSMPIRRLLKLYKKLKDI